MHGLALDPAAPIIIVGAGRSGTTRLNACLAAHPDVYMVGETQFLLRRLWTTYYEGPATGIQRRLRQLAKQSRAEWRDLPPFAFHRDDMQEERDRLCVEAARFEPAEIARLHELFGEFVVRLTIRAELQRPRWGFKEIWAGGELHPYDWDLYHAVFPRARFIQSVRHPLDYLRSVIAHLRRPEPTEAEVVHELTQWVKIVNHSRSLGATGRYTEFRMEDLDAELPRILAALDLAPDPACAAAGDFTYIPSPPRPIQVRASWLQQVPGLQALCETFAYTLPAEQASAA